MSIQYKSHIETLLGNGKSVVINKLPMSKHFTVLFDQYVKTVTISDLYCRGFHSIAGGHNSELIASAAP